MPSQITALKLSPLYTISKPEPRGNLLSALPCTQYPTSILRGIKEERQRDEKEEQVIAKALCWMAWLDKEQKAAQYLGKKGREKEGRNFRWCFRWCLASCFSKARLQPNNAGPSSALQYEGFSFEMFDQTCASRTLPEMSLLKDRLTLHTNMHFHWSSSIFFQSDPHCLRTHRIVGYIRLGGIHLIRPWKTATWRCIPRMHLKDPSKWNSLGNATSLHYRLDVKKQDKG